MKKADVNYPELRKFIKSKMTFKKYAEDVLILVPMTLTFKFNGKIPFTQEDIQRTKDYFHLTSKQVVLFFFK